MDKGKQTGVGRAAYAFGRAAARGRARGTPTGAGSAQQHIGEPMDTSSGGPPTPERVADAGDTPSPPRDDPSLRYGAPLYEEEGNNGNGDGNGNGNGNARTRAPNLSVERYELIDTRGPNTPGKRGATGRMVEVYANYFRMDAKQDTTLLQYHCTFEPQVESTRARRELFRTLQQDTMDNGGLGNCIFDGQQLWTNTRWCQNIGDTFERVIRTGNGEMTKFTFRFVAEVQPGSSLYLLIMNNLVRAALRKLNLCQVGQNYFDPNMRVEYQQHFLMLWPGFASTLRQHDGGFFYNIMTTHKVIRTENVYMLIHKISSTNRHNFREEIKNEIVDKIVLTLYNNRTYRIDDIDWNSNPNSKFEMKDGTEITFREYYRKHNERFPITSFNQPLLVSNPKPREQRMGFTTPRLLIPELCVLTGFTDQMRQNNYLMRDLSSQLFQPPQEKLMGTVAFAKRLRDTPAAKAELDKLEMDLRLAPISLNARVLPNEIVMFRNNRNGSLLEVTTDQNADFTRALKGNSFLHRTVALKNWVVMAQPRDMQGAQNFIQILQRVAKALDFNIAPPLEMIRVDRPDPSSYERACNNAKHKYPHAQMFFTVLPNNRLDCYSTVKRKCYMDYGMSSQCLVSKKLNDKGVQTIATKVAVQMNAKLGGECWFTKIPLKSTIIIGFDVHHGVKNVYGKSKSVGAMVSTTNNEFSRYYSVPMYFEIENELSQKISVAVFQCCTAYARENNGHLPDRIIFYRDGVGEGQFKYVFTTEMDLILKLLERKYTESGVPSIPKFSMIVCNKRINTRIFLKTGVKQCANVPPGTVVDNTITLPERWDFFLVSQSVRQGTVSPTNYNVIYDTNNLDSDRMQRLTFKMCHMYWNWSGTVSVPGVVQYAHKLAFLTGTALTNLAQENLANVLYFL